MEQTEEDSDVDVRCSQKPESVYRLQTTKTDVETDVCYT